MRLLLLLLCSLYFLLPNLRAQDYSVDWGPVYKKVGGRNGVARLFKLDHPNYYLLTGDYRKGSLAKFNLQHRLLDTQPIDKRVGKDRLFLSHFARTVTGDYAFYISFDRKNKFIKMYASNFRGDRLSPPQKVYEHPFTAYRYFGVLGLNDGFNQDVTRRLQVSSNDSLVVFVNPLSNKDQERTEQLAIVVFDADFKPIWDKQQDFEYNDQNIRFEQVILDDAGTVFLLARVYHQRKRPKGPDGKPNGLPDYDYRIFRVTADDFQEYELHLGDRIAPTNAGLFFPKAAQQQFLVAGIYTDEGYESGGKGVFFARGEVEDGSIQKNIHPFDQTFLADLISEERLRNDQGLENSFKIDRLIEFSDGSFSFLAEDRYVMTSSSTNSAGRTRSRNIYHSGDVIIPHFSAEGAFENIQRVEKSFRSLLPQNISYSFALYRDKVHLVFNDMKTAEERRDIKSADGGKKGKFYTDLAIINNAGEIETQTNLFNNRDIALSFDSRLFKFSGSTLIIGTSSPRKYSLGILELE
ncbi:MAG: hypothetical protein AAFW73_01345 [Bacteroidota bacterium]